MSLGAIRVSRRVKPAVEGCATLFRTLPERPPFMNSDVFVTCAVAVLRGMGARILTVAAVREKRGLRRPARKVAA